MAWAQEMKNLAADIKISHRDRAARIGGIKRETKDILGAADDYMKQVAAELKEKARDIKDFLSKSEEKRMVDFKDTMKDIKGDIGMIKGSVADTLKSTRDLLRTYAAERKEVAGYWARLKSKEAVIIEKVEKAPKKSRGRGKKAIISI